MSKLTRPDATLLERPLLGVLAGRADRGRRSTAGLVIVSADADHQSSGWELLETLICCPATKGDDFHNAPLMH